LAEIQVFLTGISKMMIRIEKYREENIQSRMFAVTGQSIGMDARWAATRGAFTAAESPNPRAGLRHVAPPLSIPRGGDFRIE